MDRTRPIAAKKEKFTDFLTFKGYDCIYLLNLVKAEFKIAINLIAGLSYRLRRVSQSLLHSY